MPFLVREEGVVCGTPHRTPAKEDQEEMVAQQKVLHENYSLDIR